jgi:hypothetical protein
MNSATTFLTATLVEKGQTGNNLVRAGNIM